MRLRCLALFDWSQSIDSFDLLRLGVDWFRSMSDLGPTFLMSTSTTKPRKISEQKLTKMFIAREAFHSIEIYPRGPDDFRRYFCLSERESGSCALTITLPAEVFEAEKAGEFLRKLAELGDLGYCTVFTQEDQSSPSFYACGITHGEIRTDEDAEIARRNSIWFMERLSMGGNAPKMRHMSGLLRDVYELNVLNASHEQAVVDGQDLVAWISESRIRGTLVRISRHNMLWSVPSVYIRHIRASMLRNGLLIS